jgi:hypothetical protein
MYPDNRVEYASLNGAETPNRCRSCWKKNQQASEIKERRTIFERHLRRGILSQRDVEYSSKLLVTMLPAFVSYGVCYIVASRISRAETAALPEPYSCLKLVILEDHHHQPRRDNLEVDDAALGPSTALRSSWETCPVSPPRQQDTFPASV